MCSFTLGGVDSEMLPEFDSNAVYANDSELTDMVVLELTVFLQFVCICFIPYHLMQEGVYYLTLWPTGEEKCHQ